MLSCKKLYFRCFEVVALMALFVFSANTFAIGLPLSVDKCSDDKLAICQSQSVELDGVLIDSEVMAADELLQFYRRSADADNKTSFSFFSHGRAGELLIDGQWLSGEALVDYLKPRLAGYKHLNIYGCEFAKGEKGKAAVAYLEEQLNVSVAASTNITGKDGDWLLETGQQYSDAFRQYAYNLQVDTDGDTINDDADLDDDNDGITDDLECPNPPQDFNTWNNGNGSWDITSDGVEARNITDNHSSSLLATQSGFLGLDKVSFVVRIKGNNASPGPTEANTATLSFKEGGTEYVRFENTNATAANYPIPGNLIVSNGATVNPATFNVDNPYVTYTITIPKDPNDDLVNFEWLFTSGADDFSILEMRFINETREHFCDLDGDGIPNNRDLDSDGDGCPDALEGGSGFTVEALTDSSIPGGNSDPNGLGTLPDYNGSSSSQVIANLSGGVGTSPSTNGIPISASTGQAVGFSQDRSTQAAECCKFGGSTDGNPTPSDSDGDGINDSCDLDDDNDGISDTLECPRMQNFNDWTIAPGSGWELRNEGVEAFNVSDAGTDQLISTDLSNLTGLTQLGITIDVRSTNANPAGQPTGFSSLDLRVDGTQFVRWSNLAPPNDNAGTVTASNMATVTPTTHAVGPFQTYTIIIPWDANQDTGQLQLAFSGGKDDIRIRNMEFGEPLARTQCDADGDGIPNDLDVDSDNDGCADAIEGAGSFTEDDLTANNNLTGGGQGTVDANGVPNNGGSSQAQGNSSNVTAAFQITVPDILDQGAAVGQNVTFTASPSGVKTTTWSSDGNGTPDFNVPPGSNVTNGYTYQWFRNGVLMSGETNASLTINNVQESNDNDLYRVEVSHPERACVIPEEARLVIEEQELTTIKFFGQETLSADGTFTVPITITVENTGDTMVDNLQVTDNLADPANFGVTFLGIVGTPTVTVDDDTSRPVAAVAPTLNSTAFNGNSQPNVLSGTDGVLGPRDILTVKYVARVDPNLDDPSNTLQNLAVGSAMTEDDTVIHDDSGGLSGGPGVPTPLPLPPTNPQLTTTKVFGKTELADDGTFTVPVTITAINTGNQNLDNLQITDVLNDASNLGAAFVSISSPPVISVIQDGNPATAVAPTANASAYNGTTQPNFFSGSDGFLGVDDSVVVVYTVKLDPNAAGAPSVLKNMALVTAEDPSNTSTTDNTGSLPGGPGDPTILPPPDPFPQITTSKTFGTQVLNADGSFTVPVTIVMDNTGDVDLTNLQITDNLADPSNLGTAFDSITVAPTVSVVDNSSGLTTAQAPTINASFDGTAANATLFNGTTGTLGVGDQAIVTFTVKINPNASNAPSDLKNLSRATADDPSGTQTYDDSGAAAGGPGEATPVTPANTDPQISATKSFGAQTLAADGTFTVPVTITVTNTGDQNINNLQITDNLADATNLGSTFKSVQSTPARTVSVNDDGNAPTAVAPSLNGAFNGSSNSNLFNGTSGLLGVGDSVTVTFTIKVDPNDPNAPSELKNLARATGDDPAGNEVFDLSGGAAGGPGVPTPLDPDETQPEIFSTKNFGTASTDANGIITLPVTIKVLNSGDVNISNLQVVDDLADPSNFGTGFQSVTVAPVISVVDDGLPPTAVAPSPNSSAFNGDTQPNLLAGNDGLLGKGDELVITFTVTADPNAAGAPDPLRNMSVSSASDPAGHTVTDLSGTPAGGEGTPTIVVDPETSPQIGLSKEVSQPTLNDDGTFDQPFTFLIRNTGDQILNDLQLLDDFNAQLGNAYTASGVADPTGGVTVAPVVTLHTDNAPIDVVLPEANIGFTGGGAQTNLFTGASSTLGLGDIIQVTVTVRIDPNAAGLPATLYNTAIVNGDDPSDTVVSDLSNNGSNPQTGAGGGSDPTPIPVPGYTPQLNSTKSFGAQTLAPDGTFTVPVTITMENTGNVDINNLQIVDDLADPNNLGGAFKGVLGYPANTTVELTNVGTGDNVTTAVAPNLNPAFTGSGANTGLLDGSSGVLGVGDSFSVTFTIRIDPQDPGAPTAGLKNLAVVSGDDPSGTETTDGSGGAPGGPGEKKKK